MNRFRWQGLGLEGNAISHGTVAERLAGDLVYHRGGEGLCGRKPPDAHLSRQEDIYYVLYMT